jgi:hypothetical protein
VVLGILSLFNYLNILGRRENVRIWAIWRREGWFGVDICGRGLGEFGVRVRRIERI